MHMAQLMPLPLAVSCSNKVQIGFTFLVPAHLGSPGQRAVERVYVCVCVCVHLPDRSEFRSTADRIGTTSSRYRRRDRRTWRYCDTGLTSRSRPPPYLLPTTPFAAAESASEKKIQNREYLANLQARAWLSRALCAPGQHTARRRRRCTRQSHSCL